MRNLIRKIIFKRKNGISIGTNVRRYGHEVLREVKNAENILLHLHPSPDPDSAGSALAMKLVLENMGKKVTLIRGDSEIPKGYLHFPGIDKVLNKNILEIDLKDFDLFIAVDSASLNQITKKGALVFPDTLRVVNIDHHETNERYGHVNLVEEKYPSCAQVLYELFLEWRVNIDKQIAENLYVGLYTDSVEFRTSLVTSKTLLIASQLKNHIGDLGKLLMPIESNETISHIKYLALMLSSVESYFNDTVAIASIDFDTMSNKGISRIDMHTHDLVPILRTVNEWQVMVSMTEVESGTIRVSTRSKDADKYDMSVLAESMGGGGHRAAAGFVLKSSLEEAKKVVLSKLKELYDLR